MVMIHCGIYKLKPKPVAVRDDWCVQCAGPRSAVKVKTFDIVHLWGIPLVPLGRIGRWICIGCRQPPDAVMTAERSLKFWLGAVASLLAALTWADEPSRAGMLILWVFRLGLIGSAVGMFWWAISPGDVERRRQIETLAPNHMPDCPLCGRAMSPGDKWRCERCAVVHVGRAA